MTEDLVASRRREAAAGPVNGWETCVRVDRRARHLVQLHGGTIAVPVGKES